MKAHLKLGTRRSLLAWAQSSWVARQIERLNPGTSVELVGIDTRGDKILDVSLQSVAGKEFFVAELDDALRSGRVDFTVHSMKDLSLDRPVEFVHAAVPPRENPRDVVLFGPRILENLRSGGTIRIGTSSPRRLENIPAFLQRALPSFGHEFKLEFVEIRGNVNTRLGRVHEPEGAPKQLDAVVLAFAGLIRLSIDEAGGAELRKLLDGVRWMVLPLRECPAAPAQGALAVECRAADLEVREMLAKLHDQKSARQVARERALLAQWGGGCHQKFGATCIENAEVGDLLYIRGRKPEGEVTRGEFVDELRWEAPGKPTPGKSWDGNAWRSKAGAGRATAMSAPAGAPAPAAFVAHSRAWSPEAGAAQSGARLWTSGVSSWFRLAAQGLWVEGCAEGLGFEPVRRTLSEKVLGLPPLEQWAVLTHSRAGADWAPMKVVETYSVAPSLWPEEARSALSAAKHVFWSSGSQYDDLGALAAKDAVHACGAGKTAQHLREKGLKPLVFPTVEEWKQWLTMEK